jgi:transposase
VTTLEDRIARLEALVERQAGVIERQAAIIVEKDAQIARLKRRVEDLERRLGERDGGGSEPPQSGEGKSREPSGKKPGGQPGHKGHRRKMVSPDKVTRTEECFPNECRGCGEKLAHTADASPVLHQVVEIPELSPDVTEFRLHRVKCACGTTTCGALPAGTPRGMMGPRLVAFVALLSANCHVSRRKVRQLLKDILGIDIALGTLSESEALATAAVDGPVREALQSALAAPVKHADGTTWYRHHAFRSLWVLATRGVTVFTTFESGTKVALSQWLGNSGILVSDRGTQLGFWSMRRRQICWAHLLRKFAWYAAQDVEATNIGRALLTYARNVLHEWHRARDGHITRATAARNTAPARDVIELLLGSGLKVPSIAGSCAHILEHRAALWTFFTRDGVEPTNNHAERELRSFVLWRKTTLGSHSARGDAFAAALKSIIQTCRKQGRHVWNYLSAAIQAHVAGRSAPRLVTLAP